jgi:hypothetical protein
MENRQAHNDDVDLSPTDRVLLEMVELRVQGASDSVWQELTERSGGVALQPLEELELLESRALAAIESGDKERGQRLLQDALALSNKKPNLLSERVARRAASYT